MAGRVGNGEGWWHSDGRPRGLARIDAVESGQLCCKDGLGLSMLTAEPNLFTSLINIWVQFSIFAYVSKGLEEIDF